MDATQLESERTAFEEAAFLQYFLSTVKRNPDPPKGTGALDFVSQNRETKADFTARNKDGRYCRETLDAAWWGWLQRAKLAG